MGDGQRTPIKMASAIDPVILSAYLWWAGSKREAPLGMGVEQCSDTSSLFHCFHLHGLVGKLLGSFPVLPPCLLGGWGAEGGRGAPGTSPRPATLGNCLSRLYGCTSL